MSSNPNDPVVAPTTTVHVERDDYDVYMGRAMPARAATASRPGRAALRQSPYANPFRIGPDGDRADVIAKYRALLEERIQRDPAYLERMTRDLKGKRLACWCAPKACHADLFVELLEGKPAVRSEDAAPPRPRQSSLF